MSRGPGRVQRQVIALLLDSPSRTLSRADLEEELHHRGVRPANALRAIKSLERARMLVFNDVADKSEASVALLAPGHRYTDDEVLGIIRSAIPR